MTVKFYDEIIAGITTFFTMAYIIVVNPLILSNAGMDYGAVFVATCLAAAVGSFFMAMLANYPVALAPSMGLNAYFSFYVIQKLHFSWQEALGIVFLSGVLFALLSLTKLRLWLIYTMPHSIKMAIGGGLGFFLIVIGIKSLKFSFFDPKILLFLFGIALIFFLERLRVMGSILLGMLTVTLLGVLFHLVDLTHIIAAPPSIKPVLFQLQFSSLFHWEAFIVVIIFLFVTLFDNTGTLIAVLHEAKLLPESNQDAKAVRLGKALFADSLATMVGALFGTSSTGSYIESATGVRAGGRTGITAIVVGLLFLVALFFAPIAAAIPTYAAATALVYVGILMAKNLKNIAWFDLTESIPAVMCALAIPIFFSIADGVVAGFISYVILKTICGKQNELNLSLWLIAFFCIIYLVIR